MQENLNQEKKTIKLHFIGENISTITAIGNDFNFDEIFSRQLMAIGKQGDLLMGISTSALSKNIYNAFKQANKMKINTIGLFGNNKTAMVRLCDISLNVKSIDTARIQEMHILIIHTICQILDEIY